MAFGGMPNGDMADFMRGYLGYFRFRLRNGDQIARDMDSFSRHDEGVNDIVIQNCKDIAEIRYFGNGGQALVDA